MTSATTGPVTDQRAALRLEVEKIVRVATAIVKQRNLSQASQ
jgi:hypothetical protein